MLSSTNQSITQADFSILQSLVFVFLLADSCSPSDSKKENSNVFPFLNTELSLEERVNDLVSRMTLEEKISQMINQAPAIERLGVPEYNWWSEGLHGVARADSQLYFHRLLGLVQPGTAN